MRLGLLSGSLLERNDAGWGFGPFFLLQFNMDGSATKLVHNALSKKPIMISISFSFTFGKKKVLLLKQKHRKRWSKASPAGLDKGPVDKDKIWAEKTYSRPIFYPLALQKRWL